MRVNELHLRIRSRPLQDEMQLLFKGGYYCLCDALCGYYLKCGFYLNKYSTCSLYVHVHVYLHVYTCTRTHEHVQYIHVMIIAILTGISHEQYCPAGHENELQYL